VTKPRSIRFRLTASYTLVFALTFALIGIAVWTALEHSIQETADRELRTRLTDVKRYVDSFTPDDFRHLEEEFREESLLSQSVANIRIADPQGHWLFRTASAERWPDIKPAGNYQTIRVGHAKIRLLTSPIRVGTVQIGLNIDEFEEVKDGFLWTIGLGSPLLLMIAAMGGYWMSGRALRPVDQISNAAAQITAQDLSARLPSSGTGDELDRLSSILNEMLRRLQSAFQRVTEFTADASHELRTPIAVIQTTSELMQSRPRTADEHLAAWSRVRSETERTSNLISDLLLLARSDANKSDLDFHSMDLAETVCSAVDEMRVMADAKGLSLSINAPAACVIQGDPAALRRAVCIMLDNAIKFTPVPGSVSVKVSQGAQALVTVTDTGVGIAEQVRPLIFERFYRVSKDRSRQTGGSGLGLSIAQSIVKRHQGDIKVESVPGKGSTFAIVLPIRH